LYQRLHLCNSLNLFGKRPKLAVLTGNGCGGAHLLI
jgi:hypothetical protein